jgi:hypothetical protein
MNKNGETAIKQLNVFIIPLTICIATDRPSAGDT